jgi:hypothetical protein
MDRSLLHNRFRTCESRYSNYENLKEVVGAALAARFVDSGWLKPPLRRLWQGLCNRFIE